MGRTRRILVILAACCLANGASAQVAVSNFYGTYAVDLLDGIGAAAPLIRWTISCQAATCSLTIDKDVVRNFYKPEPARAEHLAQARFALNYARERRVNATNEAPRLAPLLESSATFESCIDISYSKPSVSGGDEAGTRLLCKLDRNPWPRPVVLLLNNILADCGPAFCRYIILPMLQDQ